MAILTNDEYNTMRDNSSSTDDLNRRIGIIESTVLVWMSEATTLHTNSHTDDKAAVIAMRNDLKARLTAAIAL